MSDSPSVRPARLFVIRHGETEWSISGRHTGRTDIPLTAQGERNASELGDRLRAAGFSRVFTSPRQRAMRTCELAALGPAPEVEPDLAEWDYGDYEGRVLADIRRERPGWNIFLEGCPNGESPAQVSDRADRLVARLRKLDGNVAAFSHGHFGRVLAARWARIAVGEARHLLLGTASLGILASDRNDPEAPVIAVWNTRLSPEADLAGRP